MTGPETPFAILYPSEVDKVDSSFLPIFMLNETYTYSPKNESTRSCLLVMLEIEMRGKKVLDFGTGSGILAIVAAKMGATVDALDHDPKVLEYAQQNFTLNNVDINIIKEPTEHYDYIFANIEDKEKLLDLWTQCDLLVGSVADIIVERI